MYILANYLGHCLLFQTCLFTIIFQHDILKKRDLFHVFDCKFAPLKKNDKNIKFFENSSTFGRIVIVVKCGVLELAMVTMVMTCQ